MCTFNSPNVFRCATAAVMALFPTCWQILSTAPVITCCWAGFPFLLIAGCAVSCGVANIFMLGAEYHHLGAKYHLLASNRHHLLALHLKRQQPFDRSPLSLVGFRATIVVSLG